MNVKQYADYRGVHESNIRYHIREGNITAKKQGKEWVIDPDKADEEWAKIENPLHNETADRMERNGEMPEESAQEEELLSKADAVLNKAVFESKIKELQYKKMAGELVESANVYQALFEAAKLIRSNFQAIPDRHIDAILAAKTRHEALMLLKNAIDDQLEVAADAISKINIEKVS